MANTHTPTTGRQRAAAYRRAAEYAEQESSDTTGVVLTLHALAERAEAEPSPKDPTQSTPRQHRPQSRLHDTWPIL